MRWLSYNRECKFLFFLSRNREKRGDLERNGSTAAEGEIFSLFSSRKLSSFGIDAGEGRKKKTLHGGVEETTKMVKGRPKEFSEEDDKWDEAIDLTLRRFVYCTLGGAVVGFTLFRRPRTKWSAVAFGAGLGLGSAIRDSSYILGSDSAWPLDFKVGGGD